MLQIEQDFQLLYPEEAHTFTSKWEGYAAQLLPILRDTTKEQEALRHIQALFQEKQLDKSIFN